MANSVLDHQEDAVEAWSDIFRATWAKFTVETVGTVRVLDVETEVRDAPVKIACLHAHALFAQRWCGQGLTYRSGGGVKAELALPSDSEGPW